MSDAEINEVRKQSNVALRTRQNMDEFPHVSVEHEVLKRHIKYSFNPRKCQLAGLDHVPNAEDYELLKLRRVYHFNRNTPDHVVLTIPGPVFLLVDRETSHTLQNGLSEKDRTGLNEVEKRKRNENQEVIVKIGDEAESNEKCIAKHFFHEPVILENLSTDDSRKALSNLSVSFDNVNGFDFAMLNDDYRRFTYEGTEGFKQNTVVQYVNTCNRRNKEEIRMNQTSFRSCDLEVVKSQFNILNTSPGYFGNIIQQMMQNMHGADTMTIKLRKETRRSRLQFSLYCTKNFTSYLFKARRFIKLCFLSNTPYVWRSQINRTQMNDFVRINCVKASLSSTVTFLIATKDFNDDEKYMLKDNPAMYNSSGFKNYNEKLVIDGRNLVINLTALFVKLSQKLALYRKRNRKRYLLENTRKSKDRAVEEVPDHHMSHSLNTAKGNYLQIDRIETENKSITQELPRERAGLDFFGFGNEEQTVHKEVDQIQFFMDILNTTIRKPSEASPKHEKLSRHDFHKQLFIKSAELLTCSKCCEHFPSAKRLERHLKTHQSERNEIGEKPYNPTSNELRTPKADSSPEAETERTDEELECDQCGYITMYRNKLDAHMEIHDTKQIYRCGSCSFSTAQLSYFKTHRLFHQVEVKKHVKSETEEKHRCEEKYRCEECGFSSKLRYAMVHHGKEQHSAEAFINVAVAGSRTKKKMCTRCAYSGQKKVLSKHRNAHKKCKCDFCGFVIYSNQKFRTHCLERCVPDALETSHKV